MTIHEGMCEAFRRLGASGDEIEAVIEENDRIFPLVGSNAKEEQIPPGWEEDFVSAYMKFTAFICEDSPFREQLRRSMQEHIAKN